METWPTGTCKSLKGFPGYFELRWTSEKVAHRILGYFEGPKTFVMLVGCTHKGKVYDPPGAFQTMLDRKQKLIQKEGSLAKYDLAPVG